MATKCIIGLGNPRKEYERTRHNAGFMAVEALAKHLGLTWKVDTARKSIIAEGNIDGTKLVLVKPQTYMNNSGEAVRAMMDYLHCTPNDCIIVADDVALPLGTIRVRGDGSAGGHNGFKSIIEHIGTQTFRRVRIGVNPPPVNVPLEIYVLEKFAKSEHAIVDKAVEKVVELLSGLDTPLAETTYTVSA